MLRKVMLHFAQPANVWRRSLLAARLLAACWLLLAVQTSNAQAFTIRSHVVHLDEERGSMTVWTLTTEEGRFSFSAPHDWRVTTEADNKTVMMTSPDDSCILRLQVGKPLPELKSGAPAKELTAKVKQRFPTANLLEEFTCYSGVGEGRAFDLNVTEANFTTHIRLAYLSLSDASITFILQSPGDQLEKAKRALAGVLHSLEHSKASDQRK